MQTSLSKEFKGIIDLTAGRDSKGLHHHYHLPKRFIELYWVPGPGNAEANMTEFLPLRHS